MVSETLSGSRLVEPSHKLKHPFEIGATTAVDTPLPRGGLCASLSHTSNDVLLKSDSLFIVHRVQIR
jgi:hypothetical protein